MTINPWDTLEIEDLREIISQLESCLNTWNQQLYDHPNMYSDILDLAEKLTQDGVRENTILIMCLRYASSMMLKNTLEKELFNRENET